MGIFKHFIRIALIGCLGLIGSMGLSNASTGVHTSLISGPYAYITNYSSNNVSVIDTATDAVIATVSVGYGPYGVAVSPDATRVYVANYAGSSVSVIDTVTNTVIATVPIATRPYGLAVSPDGSRVYVVAYYTNNVSVIDAATNTVSAVIPVGQRPHGIVVSRDGKRVYVANYATNDISVIDASLNSVVATIALPANSNPFGLAQTLDSSKLYVTGWSSNAIYVVDTASSMVTATIPVGIRPVSVAVTPDASRVYVSNYSGSATTTVSVIDASTDTVVTDIPLPTGVAPSGVSVHPDGSRVYVASYSTGVVYVIDPATNTIIQTVTVGARPYAFGSFISIPQPTLIPTLQPAIIGGYINNPTPTIIFKYGTQCIKGACQVSNNYFSTFSLQNALLNTQQIGNLTTFSPISLNAGQPGATANYTPQVPLLDGNYTITAQVQDIFGRLTTSPTLTFTVDTVAPRFLTLNPPDNGIYLNPPVTVSGTIDDPTASVYLSGPLLLTNSSGTSFSFPVTLLPGLNSFYLSLVDPAGNTTHAALNLTYTPFTLNVLSPLNGANINANQVTVYGNFSGATTATVKVNGANATVTGRNFSAANIPLVYGSNLLTVNGTRSDDGKAITQTITLTSTLPVLTIAAPANGATLSTNSATVTGTVQASPYSTVLVNGVSAIITGNSYSATVPLTYGANTLTAVVNTPGLQPITQAINVTSTAIGLTISGPATNTTTNASNIIVTGTFQGPSNSTVTINGVAATVTGNTFTAQVPVVYGSNILTAIITTPSGATATQSINVTGLAPTLSIASPGNGLTINTATTTVTGTFQGSANFTIKANGVAASLSGTTYSAIVPLAYGSNTLTVIATDGIQTLTQTVNVTSTAPSVSFAGAVISGNGAIVSGTFQGPTGTSVTLNGIAATLNGTTFSGQVPLVYGSNTIQLVATTPGGGSATQTLTINSIVPTLTITSPLPGTTINSDTTTVTGTLQGPAGSTVLVNGITATVNGNGYSAANVPVGYGNTTLTATATAPDGSLATSTVNVVGTSTILQISSPLNGAAINGDAILATGHFQGPLNSGVTVNGVIANIVNGTFYANNVPLASGANTLTATYTMQDGTTASQVINVTSTGTNPIQVGATDYIGIAPMAFDLSAIATSGNAIQTVSADPGIGGSVGAITVNGANATFPLTYASPGTYTPTVTVTDSTGTYSQSVTIVVQASSTVDTLLGSLWSGMNNALVTGNKPKAMTYLSTSAQAKYGPIFDVLLPSYSQVIRSWSPLLKSNLSSSIGEYGVVTNNANGTHLFLIYFLMGSDGVWRLESM